MARRLGKVQFYKADGLWRWRVRAPNGLILSQSSESYEHFADCERGMVLTREALLYVPATGGPVGKRKMIVAQPPR